LVYSTVAPRAVQKACQRAVKWEAYLVGDSVGMKVAGLDLLRGC
jgi:hypothetical protein